MASISRSLDGWRAIEQLVYSPDYCGKRSCTIEIPSREKLIGFHRGDNGRIRLVLVDEVIGTSPKFPFGQHQPRMPEGVALDNQLRNPAWNRDELILALNLYMTNPASPPGKESSQVAALSGLLNKMHRLAGNTGAPTLRNANGVYLKMMNLRALDPAFTAQGKVGMQAGGKLEKVLWAEYDGHRTKLASDAAAIKQLVDDANEAYVASLPAVGDYEGEEGGVTIRLHKRYERDPKLVLEKRKAAQAAGQLTCEVCAFDFEAVYGELGKGYIEVHHTKPVHQLTPGSKTKLSDLALLCANCHRMAHRRRQPLSLAELKQARGFPPA